MGRQNSYGAARASPMSGRTIFVQNSPGTARTGPGSVMWLRHNLWSCGSLVDKSISMSPPSLTTRDTVLISTCTNGIFILLLLPLDEYIFQHYKFLLNSDSAINGYQYILQNIDNKATFQNWLFYWCGQFGIYHIDGSVQDCSNFTANTLELPQSCTEPSTCLWCLVSNFINLIFCSNIFWLTELGWNVIFRNEHKSCSTCNDVTYIIHFHTWHTSK